MAHIEREIFIHAAPRRIWDYTSDPNTLPNWYEGIVEARSEHTEPVLGGKVEQVYTASGARFEMSTTVIAVDPPKSITFKMEGMVTGTNQWDYLPEADGTRVRAIFDYEMAGGPLGKIADKLLIERINTSQLEKSLQNLKKNIEG